MKAPSMAKVPGPVSCAGGRCEKGWVEKHGGAEEEDNEGVCGPPCSCRRRGDAELTDKIVRQPERWKEGRTAEGVQKMETGLQTEDWAVGAERYILVWHRGGLMDGTNKPASKSYADVYITVLTFAQILAYICVCILTSTSISAWICIYMRQ